MRRNAMLPSRFEADGISTLVTQIASIAPKARRALMPSTSMPNLTLEAAPVDSAVLPLLVADGLLAFEPGREGAS